MLLQHSTRSRLRNTATTTAQRSMDHRGTPAFPGLVATLVADEHLQAMGLRDASEPQSETFGAVYRIPDEDAEQVLADLDHRYVMIIFTSSQVVLYFAHSSCQASLSMQSRCTAQLLTFAKVVYVASMQSRSTTCAKLVHTTVQFVLVYSTQLFLRYCSLLHIVQWCTHAFSVVSV
jgi:cation transport regulator ChaC